MEETIEDKVKEEMPFLPPPRTCQRPPRTPRPHAPRGHGLGEVGQISNASPLTILVRMCASVKDREYSLYYSSPHTLPYLPIHDQPR